MRESLPAITRDIFEQAANASGTDKGNSHGYHRFYPLFLSHIDRLDSFTIVEIGYGGGASIPMWKTLFPNSNLICIDKDVSMQGDGYEVIQADQSDPNNILETLSDLPTQPRLVVDDGSHHPQHQLTSFSVLFEDVLEPGGLYILEDIETSYWLSGNLYGNQLRYGLFCRWSAVETLKLTIDYTNRKFLSPEDKNHLEYAMLMSGLAPASAGLISSITFGQNCALISKIIDEDQKYINGDYAYSHFVQR